MDDPQLRHVRSFVAVAEELHFGRAAARLGIAQPAVSRHVRALEAVIGTPLLERTSRFTTLTDAGRAALGPARELLATAERLTAAGAARGDVTVGFTANTVQGWSGLVRGHIVQLRVTDLAAAVRRGSVDLAITRWLPRAPDLLQTQIAEDGVAVAVPAAHRFAGRASIAPAELDGEPAIMLERRIWPDGYDAALELLREQGIAPSLVRHTTTPAAALALVAAGAGLYRLAASAVTPRPGVAFVTVEGWSLPIVLIRRPEPPRPAVAAAIARLEAAGLPG
jgi:LysR family transcriptional regulator, benzoate and cis,cis-muconate-responsive activator of ben and cat genes